MRNLIYGIGVGLLSVVLCSPRPGVAQEMSQVLEALPGGGDAASRLEAAWVSRDLRLQLKEMVRYRATVMQTKAGAAFYSASMQVETYGYDMVTELSAVLALASPAGQPVPAAMAVVSSRDGLGLQLMLKVEAGFLARVDAALKSATPPAWKATVNGDVLVLPIGPTKLVGGVDGQGWLRMSLENHGVSSGNSPPRSLFEGTMAKWALDADMMLFVRGGGMVSQTLSRLVDDGLARSLIDGAQSLALTWKFDGDRTSVSRLLLDAPVLKELRAAVRRPDLQNRLVALWGDEATAYLGMALPPKILEALVPIAQQQLAGSPYELPPKLTAAIGKLDGQVGVVGFGSPGDYAMGVEFVEAGVAQETIPVVQEWLTRVMTEAGAKLRSMMSLEPFPGATAPVLHFRPDAGLEGMRLAAIGTTLVAVHQQSRLAALQARAGKAPATGSSPKGEDGLTPLMRQVMSGPAMIVGYLLLSDDGSMFDYLAWMTGGVYEAVIEKEAKLKDLAFLAPYFRRLPTVLTLAGFSWALHYDVGLVADIDESILVIQLLSSEI